MIVIEPFGDEALLVTLGDAVDEGTNDRVHWLSAALTAARGNDPASSSPVPAYASLLVPYDPLVLDVQTASDHVRSVVDAMPDHVGSKPSGSSKPIEIGVRYGGADGPDLLAVAELTGLSPAQVVDVHVSTVYRVFMLGFMPGFAYLGVLPQEISVPRRPSPRERVPAGSVAVAECQTAVYPSATPGGWQLIGRTDASLWDPDRQPPTLLAPGQRVRFVPLRG